MVKLSTYISVNLNAAVTVLAQKPSAWRTPLFRTFLLFCLASLTWGAIFFYFWIFADLPHPSELVLRDQKLTTIVYDRNGRELYKFYEGENRTLVNLDQVPEHVLEAVVSAEDKNFYHHQGLSLSGILRAVNRNLTQNDLQGGSTITQQLVKNALLDHQRTWTRKIKEIFLALETEALFSKDEIMEMYLNEVGFGGPAYGIQEASRQYFGKDISQVTVAEAAFLGGLPQSPTKYSPYGAHPEQAKARQQQVLHLMVENGYLTPQEESDALKEPLRLRPPRQNIEAPHFVMYVKDLLVDYLGEEAVNHGGLRIYTTLDLELQDKVQAIVTAEVSGLRSLNVSNGSALIISPDTGEILAMIGSVDYFDTKNDGQVNLTTALRQPGSSVKPITYALAFQHGITPSTILEDSPITFNIAGSEPYTPVNYDRRFHGRVTARTALGSSYNVPAVKLLANYGPREMAKLAQKMGVTTWDNPKRYGLSLTLGSIEVRMLDLVQAYSVFANSGRYIPLTPIKDIFDSHGNRLEGTVCVLPYALQGKPDCPSPHQALDPQIAYLINDILSDNSARAPAFGSSSVLNIPLHQVAVKTGTSNNLRDNWTLGYTSDFLVATWVGNNDNRPMSRIASGITGASPLWSKIMKDHLTDIKIAHRFPSPENIIEVAICPLTDTLTCSECPSPRKEKYIRGTEPKAACTNELIQAILSPTPSDQPAGEHQARLLDGASHSRL